MAVRSGLVDDWDEIDELQTLVAHCEPMTKAAAGELIPRVRQLLRMGLNREALAVTGQQVEIRVVGADRERVKQSVRELGMPGVLVIDRP